MIKCDEINGVMFEDEFKMDVDVLSGILTSCKNLIEVCGEDESIVPYLISTYYNNGCENLKELYDIIVELKENEENEYETLLDECEDEDDEIVEESLGTICYYNNIIVELYKRIYQVK